jgi:hypothetical protein
VWREVSSSNAINLSGLSRMKSKEREETSLPKENIDELFQGVGTRLAALETNLPKSVDGFALSAMTKVPFKAVWYRESLCWRMAQLSRSALECFEKKKLASAILLTRASMETSAALWFFREILERSNEVQAISETDQRLVQLLMGSRIENDIFPKAESVLKFVDRVDKKVPGFRHQYDRLSEFAHPNWSGTALLFSKCDEGGVANFGENMRSEENVLLLGLHNLTVVLDLFQFSYDRVGGLMSEFVRLCEANVKMKDDGNS